MWQVTFDVRPDEWRSTDELSVVRRLDGFYRADAIEAVLQLMHDGHRVPIPGGWCRWVGGK